MPKQKKSEIFMSRKSEDFLGKKLEVIEEKKAEIKEASAEETKENLLVPLDEYKKAGISLGTKVITSFMKKYVFKRRPDGLATINTSETDKKLRDAISFLSEYKPEEIVLACKRESGWRGAELFGQLTGVKVFTKKYPSGIMTNPNLDGFFEPSLLFIVDPWIDKSILSDAVRLNLPVVSLCDTNNITQNIDLIVPCNNKSNKSMGLIFFIMARELAKKWNPDVKIPPLEEFTGPE